MTVVPVTVIVTVVLLIIVASWVGKTKQHAPTTKASRVDASASHHTNFLACRRRDQELVED